MRSRSRHSLGSARILAVSAHRSIEGIEALEEGIDGGPRPVRILAVGHLMARRRTSLSPRKRAWEADLRANIYGQWSLKAHQGPPCVTSEDMK